MSQEVNHVQEMIDIWLKKTEKCPNEYNEDRDSTDDICYGTRKELRYFVETSPVAIIRVYEHAMYGRISFKCILNSNQICIDDNIYQLAGITMHRDSHYCSVIVSQTYGNVWYDGLVGRLQKLPKRLDTWFPSNAVYCKIS